MEKQCKDCEFYREVDVQGRGHREKGFCLRYPPTVADAVLQTFQGKRGFEDLMSSSVIPVTDGGNFCGEFVHKPGDPQVTVI